MRPDHWSVEAVDCPICGRTAHYNRARTVFCGTGAKNVEGDYDTGCGAVVGRSGHYTLHYKNYWLDPEIRYWTKRRKPLPIYPVCDGSVVRA